MLESATIALFAVAVPNVKPSIDANSPAVIFVASNFKWVSISIVPATSKSPRSLTTSPVPISVIAISKPEAAPDTVPRGKDIIY